MSHGSGSGLGLGLGLLLLLIIIPAGAACTMSDDLWPGRYMDDSISGLWVNCSGTSADDCYYVVNDFVNVTIVDCANFTFEGVVGMNSVELCGSNTTAWNCSLHTLWMKKLGGTVWDYMNLWILLLLFCACWVAGEWTGIGVFSLLAGLVGCLMGYEALAIAWLPGVVLMIMMPVACLVYTLRK